MRTVICLVILGLTSAIVRGQDPGTLKWSFTTTGEVFSSPTIDIDGVIYVGVNDAVEDEVNDNRVIALNPDGALKWEAVVGDWIETVPALGQDGVLYVTSWDGYLYALDCETGAEIWKFETFGIIESSPAIGEDGVVYFGNSENALYAVNPDGTPAWETVNNGGEADPFLFDDWVDGSPTLDDQGNIWVGDLFGNLKQIAPNKTELWSVDLGFGIPASPAIAQDGTVYIADEDGFVIAITPGNQNPKWSFNTGFEAIESSPIIGPNGVVYVGSGSDSVYAFDGQTGAVISGWPFTEPTDVVYSTPAIAENGTVYIGSGDSKLYAVSDTGVKLWEFDTAGFVDSSPAIGPDGTVYFGSTDGKVYAVHGDSPLGFSRWPKHRGSLAANGRVDPYRLWVEEQGLSEPNPASDPDGDNLENFLEWAFCTDPQVAGLNDAKFPFTTLAGGDLLLDAEWLEKASAMRIEFSENLFDWEDLDLGTPENYSWLDGVSSQKVNDKLQVQLDMNLAVATPNFFRLKGIQN